VLGDDDFVLFLARLGRLLIAEGDVLLGLGGAGLRRGSLRFGLGGGGGGGIRRLSVGAQGGGHQRSRGEADSQRGTHIGEEEKSLREGANLDIGGVAVLHARDSICRMLWPAGGRALGGVRAASYSSANLRRAWGGGRG